ncbi:unnamed protein product [Urochloa decumbens]|uniref:Protein kinase domain-containing protein n=1 Tax=Urochloa decumbens TaxID=240449 RepID=A0ABC8XYP6_9POAL
MGWTTKARVPMPGVLVQQRILGCCWHATSALSRGGRMVVVDVPELTVREVNEATARFSGARLIGEGEHARVYRASLRTGKAAAAKRLVGYHWSWPQRGPPARVHRVAADLRVLLYEFADMGTLHDALHLHGDRPALSWAQRVRVALDAARGLAYLHGFATAAGAVHGEVRSSKVLLFPGFRAKVADGHNMFHQPDLELGYAQVRHASAMAYLSPECFSTGRMMPKSDVFSFGLVLLELLTGAKPFDDTDREDCCYLWSWAAPFLAEGRVEECIDPKLGDQYPRAGALELATIAVQCLQKDPTSRPSMDTVARLINCDIIMRDQHGRRLL